VAFRDDEFETMLARGRSYRVRIDQLGSLNRPIIDGHLRDRVRRRPTTNTLPPPQVALADEIFAVLRSPKLSALQAARLEREFFGTGRGSRTET
jgi:hypothetical protein